MKLQALFSWKNKSIKISVVCCKFLLGALTLLHPEKPKLYAILAFLSAVGLRVKVLQKCCHPSDVYKGNG